MSAGTLPEPFPYLRPMLQKRNIRNKAQGPTYIYMEVNPLTLTPWSGRTVRLDPRDLVFLIGLAALAFGSGLATPWIGLGHAFLAFLGLSAAWTVFLVVADLASIRWRHFAAERRARARKGVGR